jgi:hypothetical protein
MDQKKIIGPAKSYCTLVDEALIKKAEGERDNNKYYPLRPSAAGYCARKLTYDTMAFLGIWPKKHEERKPSVIRLLSLGHSIEYHALRNLELIDGFQVKYKQQTVSMFRLTSGRLIEGSIDAVMWSDEHKAVLDVKSVGDRFDSAFATKWKATEEKYDKLPSMEKFDESAWHIADPVAFLNDVGPDDPVAQNIQQINLYLCSDFLKERGVTHGVIYRYAKNNSAHQEIRFAPSETLFHHTKAKFDEIEQAALAKKPERVEREMPLGSMACAFCPYAEDCRPGYNTKKDWFKTFPPRKWPTKIGELSYAEELEELFAQRAKHEAETMSSEAVANKILLLMEQEQVEKLQLEDGSIYERKFLKSPYPHFELRKVAK